MCIRDSQRAKNLLREKRNELEILANRLLEKEVLLKSDVTAVSYTHLRAHETVLDIVCRLLLEKKKNKEKPLTHITLPTKQTECGNGKHEITQKLSLKAPSAT